MAAQLQEQPRCLPLVVGQRRHVFSGFLMNLPGKATVLLLTALSCGAALAQEYTSDLFIAANPPANAISNTDIPEAPLQHQFWDSENRALFSLVAASSAADFVVTKANLQHGGTELNPVTRLFAGSTAGLAANFAGETAGVVGVSYLLHRTGHHKLERIAPAANFAASAFAVGYGLAHRR